VRGAAPCGNYLTILPVRELKNDRALAGPGIEIDQNYFLPGAGQQSAAIEWDGKGWHFKSDLQERDET
jgi:hypothetical protein